MTDPIAHFAEVAAEFCAWAESTPKSEEEEGLTALRLLPALYLAGLDLPVATPANDDPEDMSFEVWKAFLLRFSSLPVGSYSSVLDPLNSLSQEVGIGTVSDDLADIYRDLVGPLKWYRAGRTENAALEWRFHFRAHFGDHIAGALQVLHLWLKEDN